MDAWIAGESTLRYYALIGAFGLIAVWEALAPRRVPVPAVRGRWAVNIALTVLLSVVIAVVFPVLSVGTALVAQRHGWGLFNQVDTPFLVECLLAFLALDFARYAMHMALHRIGPLWRLHRVHHSDVDYDSTTSLRFHPLEAVVTVGAQLAAVVALGAPVVAVLAYEMASVLITFFSHGNVRIPERLDRALRWFVVTPDLHRVHHSAIVDESNANFSSVLPWWDHALRTYRAQPALGHEAMEIGLADVRDARARSFRWLIAAPFAMRSAAPT